MNGIVRIPLTVYRTPPRRSRPLPPYPRSSSNFKPRTSNLAPPRRSRTPPRQSPAHSLVAPEYFPLPVKNFQDTSILRRSIQEHQNCSNPRTGGLPLPGQPDTLPCFLPELEGMVRFCCYRLQDSSVFHNRIQTMTPDTGRSSAFSPEPDACAQETT